MQPALYLPQEARISHPEFSEKSDIFSLGVLLVQIINREANHTNSSTATCPSLWGRQEAAAHPKDCLHIPGPVTRYCTSVSQRYCNGVSNTLTKLAAVKYHPQYEDSLKQERELAQEEIAQLLKELKSKGEQIQQNQESQKQLEISQQEIVQLKEKLKSEEEFVLKLEQERARNNWKIKTRKSEMLNCNNKHYNWF